MKISLETTPFLEHEVALVLGLSIDEAQRYFDDGICTRSVELVTGFANVVCFPNFYDVVCLGITHCLMPSNRLAQYRSVIGDEVANALFYFLDDQEASDPLGTASCRLFRKSMLDWKAAGFLEGYPQLDEQERTVVLNNVLRTCLRTRKHILQNYLTNSQGNDVCRHDDFRASDRNRQGHGSEVLRPDTHRATGSAIKTRISPPSLGSFPYERPTLHWSKSFASSLQTQAAT